MRYAAFAAVAAALIAALGLCQPALSAAAEQEKGDHPPVREIVERASYMSYYQGKDGRAQVRMTIAGADGSERIREFTMLRRDSANEGMQNVDQKFYLYFHRPSDVREMVFMVWKHVAAGKDDDRWLYLPALDLVKRIAATDERTSFVGSHFFYEDVSGRNITEDTHELVQVTENYYVVESTPKEPGQVEFSYYRNYIHRDTFIPVQTEYFDKNREKYREYKVLQVETIQGFKTVTKSRMKDLRSGGQTTIEYRNVTYNVGLPESIFTERYLRKPPMQHMR
jgi:outer membrane lipoprotein-sorting protein